MQLRYAEGASVLRNLPPCSKGVVDVDGNPGFSFQSFNEKGEAGPTKNQPSSMFQSRDPTGYSRVVLTGTFTPSVSGKHYISLATLGNTKVHINDALVYNIEGKSADVYAILMGVAVQEQKQFNFVAGEPYQIRLEACTVEDPDVEESFMSKYLRLNFGFMEQQIMEADLLQEAVDIADSPDVAIVFVGNTPA